MAQFEGGLDRHDDVGLDRPAHPAVSRRGLDEARAGRPGRCSVGRARCRHCCCGCRVGRGPRRAAGDGLSGDGVGRGVDRAGQGADGQVVPQGVERPGVTGLLERPGLLVERGVPTRQGHGRPEDQHGGLVVGIGEQADPAGGVLGRHTDRDCFGVQSLCGPGDELPDPPHRQAGRLVGVQLVDAGREQVRVRIQGPDEDLCPLDRGRPVRKGLQGGRQTRRETGGDPQQRRGRPVGRAAGDRDLPAERRPWRGPPVIERAPGDHPGQRREHPGLLGIAPGSSRAVLRQRRQTGPEVRPVPRRAELGLLEVPATCHAESLYEHTFDDKP